MKENNHNKKVDAADSEFPVIPKLKGRVLDSEGIPSWIYEFEEEDREFIRIVGVSFNETGRVFDFNAGDLSLEFGAAVIAEVPEKGLMYGTVAKPPIKIDNTQLKLKPRRVLRAANEQDEENYRRQKTQEASAYKYTKNYISQLNLNMKLLRVDFTLDRRKVLIYFSTENRVDFRELLKMLIRDLKVRVELRQVGVRDQTKMEGALGACGVEACCSRFIDNFHGVSIKMAKVQGLSLKPTKVSGVCGRLKCCLAYEYKVYENGIRKLPTKGKCVSCGNKCGIVQDVDVLRQLVTIMSDDGVLHTVKAQDVVEANKKNDPHPKEKIVATTDEDILKDQILTAAGHGDRENGEVAPVEDS